MKYLVLAVYEDDYQPWADSYDVDTPEAAIALAHRQVMTDGDGEDADPERELDFDESPLIIAGVVFIKDGDMVVAA